jgi:hypothetical protein
MELSRIGFESAILWEEALEHCKVLFDGDTATKSVAFSSVLK